MSNWKVLSFSKTIDIFYKYEYISKRNRQAKKLIYYNEPNLFFVNKYIAKYKLPDSLLCIINCKTLKYLFFDVAKTS